MTTDINRPASRNWIRWFDPRGRELGTLGFALNRISAIGLTIYLFLHLIVLSQLASGPDSYDEFLETIHNPVYITGELLVVTAVFFHGLNGIRIVLNSFGVGIRYQKAMLAVVGVISVIGTLIFAVKMFS